MDSGLLFISCSAVTSNYNQLTWARVKPIIFVHSGHPVLLDCISSGLKYSIQSNHQSSTSNNNNNTTSLWITKFFYLYHDKADQFSPYGSNCHGKYQRKTILKGSTNKPKHQLLFKLLWLPEKAKRTLNHPENSPPAKNQTSWNKGYRETGKAKTKTVFY